MSITAAIVLFAVLWFLTLLVVLPLQMVTQGEAGEVVPGTHSSSPANVNVKRKVVVTTIAACVLWVIFYWVLTSGVITIRDIDFMGIMPPKTELN